MRNYYEILDVPLSASVEDIKKGYRYLAKRFHPDVCKNKDSGKIFNLITTAYKILSNEKSRLKYNKKLLDIRFRPEEVFSDQNEKKVRVIYSRSLSALAKRGFFLSNIPKKYRKRMDIKYDVEAVIDYVQSRKGGIIDISVPTKLPCPDCNGQDHYCRLCDGKSYIIRAIPVKVILPKEPQSGEIFEVNLTGMKKGHLAVIRANKLRIKIILTHQKTTYKQLESKVN